MSTSTDEKRKLNENCPCTYRDCPRNRDCKACKEYHHATGAKTTCERQKAQK